jgi:hypothetical protein
MKRIGNPFFDVKDIVSIINPTQDSRLISKGCYTLRDLELIFNNINQWNNGRLLIEY